MTDEGYRARVRRTIALTALDMLAGRVSFIEGARCINGLRGSIGLSWEDFDFQVFLLIDSETDVLPLAEVRKLWAPDALKKLQPEIDRSEAWAKEVGRRACENIVRRFHEPSKPTL